MLSAQMRGRRAVSDDGVLKLRLARGEWQGPAIMRASVSKMKFHDFIVETRAVSRKAVRRDKSGT
jgi:hypothetical protein